MPVGQRMTIRAIADKLEAASGTVRSLMYPMKDDGCVDRERKGRHWFWWSTGKPLPANPTTAYKEAYSEVYGRFDHSALDAYFGVQIDLSALDKFPRRIVREIA